MSTYTGSTGATRGVGETIWLAVITFVAASALVLALFAMQRGGSTSGPTVLGPAGNHSVVIHPHQVDNPIVPKGTLTPNQFHGHPLP